MHLLHEDEKRRSYGSGMRLEEICLEAKRTVCREMLAVNKTLRPVEQGMQVRGWLELPEILFY